MDNLTILKKFGDYWAPLLLLVLTDQILKLAYPRYFWAPGTVAQAVYIEAYNHPLGAGGQT